MKIKKSVCNFADDKTIISDYKAFSKTCLVTLLLILSFSEEQK